MTTRHKQTAPRLRFKGFDGAWEENELQEILSIRKEYVNPSFYDLDVELENLVSNSGVLIGDTSVRTQTNSFFQKGDILFGRLRPYLNKWWLAEKDGVKSGEIWALETNSPHSNFFAYLIVQSEKFLEAANVTSGTKMPRADWGNLKEITFNLPSENEQAQLGNFFRELDHRIAQSRALWEKSRQLKKAMLAKMFPAAGETAPKIRFKGFTGKWERKTLGEVADFAKGKGLSKSSIDNNGKNHCILYGELYTKYGCYIDEIVSSTSENIENPTLSKSNDVLMPTSDVTPTGLAKACAIYLDNIVLGGDILVVRSTEMSGLFFAYFVESNPSAIIEKATGTTVFHIYAKDLRDIIVPLPSYEEQTAIGNFFCQLDDTIALYALETETLGRLKKALLAAMLV